MGGQAQGCHVLFAEDAELPEGHTSCKGTDTGSYTFDEYQNDLEVKSSSNKDWQKVQKLQKRRGFLLVRKQRPALVTRRAVSEQVTARQGQGGKGSLASVYIRLDTCLHSPQSKQAVLGCREWGYREQTGPNWLVPIWRSWPKLHPEINDTRINIVKATLHVPGHCDRTRQPTPPIIRPMWGWGKP